MKRFDLTHLEKGATAKASAPRKAAFMERARRGHFGDMRLLGLCAGIIALCVLSVAIRPGEAPEPETVLNAVEPVLANAADGQDYTESALDDSAYYDLEGMAASETVTREQTPEERDRAIREMARNVPEGQTLLW